MLVSSPRTWGCFCNHRPANRHNVVFPTHVGVFLDLQLFGIARGCLPHARGGVSGIEDITEDYDESSPRTWGCFQGASVGLILFPVFPTHVGVFPPSTACAVPGPRLPHARGGVSNQASARLPESMSSPRTWGCFQCRVWHEEDDDVFPTHVGVFPVAPDATLMLACLPHARGGVS